MDFSNLINFLVETSNIDYEYAVGEFNVDINNIKIDLPTQNEPPKTKDQKKKLPKDKNAKDKKKGGNNISKQSSGLAASSNKKKFIIANNKEVLNQIQGSKKIQQHFKNVQKGFKNSNKKIEKEIKDIIINYNSRSVVNKNETKENVKNEEKEEIVFTGERKEENEIIKKNKNEDSDEDDNNKNKENQKKNHKKNKTKNNNKKNQPLTETKADESENKQVDDLISQIKNKKLQKNIANEVEIQNFSIKNYMKQFKSVLAEDATKRLKVRETSNLEDEFLNDFTDKFVEFSTVLLENYNKNKEFFKINLKEFTTLLDNLSEFIISKNMSFNLLDKSIDVYLILCGKMEEKKKDLDIFLLNIIYLYAKYDSFSRQKLFSIIIPNINNRYNSNLSNQKLSITNEEFEVVLLMKLMLLVFNSNSTNQTQFDSRLLEKLTDNNEFDEEEIGVNPNQITVRRFVEKLDKFKLLIKLSSVLNKHRNSINSLNMVVTKGLEAKMIEIQKNFVLNNRVFFMKNILDILQIIMSDFDQYQNFEHYFEEKSLSGFIEELNELIKLLCDENIFDDNIFKENFSFDFNYDKVRDMSLDKEEYSKIYIKYLCEYLKIYDRIIKNKNDFEFLNNSIKAYILFFHSILIQSINLKTNIYSEKFLEILKHQISKHFQNQNFREKLIDYLVNYVEKNIIENNDMKNIKISKEIFSFYKTKDIKIDFFEGIRRIPNEKSDFAKSIIISYFLMYLNDDTVSKKDQFFAENQEILRSLIFYDNHLANYYLKNTFIKEISSLKRFEINNFPSINPQYLLENLVKNFDNPSRNFNISKFFKILENTRFTIKDFDVAGITKTFIDLKNKNLIDSFIIFTLNKAQEDENNEELFKVIDSLEQFIPSTSINIKDEIRKVNIIEDYNFDLSMIFKVQDDIIPNLIQVLWVANKINVDPNYYKKTEESVIKLDIMLKFLILLMIFIRKEVEKNLNSDGLLIVLNYVHLIQKSMKSILLNDTIFKSFVKSNKLLTLFVKEYSNLSLDINKIFEVLESKFSPEFKEFEVKEALLIKKYIKKITITFSSFIQSRCANQLIFIFSENELYRLASIKDKKLSILIFSQLNTEYIKTILDENKMKELKKKLDESEDDDSVANISNMVFSKEIMKFIEFPREIIDYLSSMHEGIKLGMKGNHLNPSIFSYLYIWKMIMSKIENGFKLFTTDKKYVQNIEDYKTVLRILVNYFGGNNKNFEMFLLIIMTLVHLDEDYVDKFLSGSSDVITRLDEFDEKSLSEDYDENFFYFILDVLYKFVKIFPSHVKFWFDNSPKKLHTTFNKLIKNIINIKIMKEIKEKINAQKNIMLKAGVIIKEIKSQNNIEIRLNLNEEIHFEVVAEFPNIFPLKKINLKLNSNANLDEMKVMTVKMSLNNVFNNSIDNVTDNLSLWAQNVKQVLLTGLDCCPICYYYVNQTDKGLPKSCCRTCKKKFHSLCMKEWFKNAEKQTCPTCRSEWSQQSNNH